ncbi:BolA family protein [Balneatrix alpica]|uniref:BolA family protein n=1 Tax=Balneatrix alpica TaxID=75684 RepID=A0ABV5Z8Y3_9GAMM|nr:BolA family protein [Balneatrix alpica]
MQASEVKSIIEAGIADAQVLPEGEGCNFQVVVISPAFAGLSPVKKQQMVYATLAERIADGSIHALTIKAYTPEQWQALQG